jgi:putative two-component system response regulator
MGYPFGMSGEDIPRVARIVALADVFDVLTHERPYKEAWPVDRALAEVERERGSHFDPDVVDAFMRLDHPALRFPTGASTIASLAHS